MNGRWIDQFPPEREYDLEIDEDTYELQMADTEVAQEAAARAEAAAAIAVEKAIDISDQVNQAIEGARVATQKAAEAGNYADGAEVSARVAVQNKNEAEQAKNLAVTAKNDTQAIKEEVEQIIEGIDEAGAAADASAQAAARSATAAAGSASDAASNATAAAGSASAAAQSAQNAAERTEIAADCAERSLQHVEDTQAMMNQTQEEMFIAQEKAREAATSATNASNSATEAVQAAQTAVENADYSETQRIAAEGAAVSAADSAESATQSAEAAANMASDTQSMIATVETTEIASKDYAVDDLLIYEGVLYKVSNTITLGDTLIPNSNIEETTVEESLTTTINNVVPSWAKASTKPSYTASEVGAPTVQEMNTAINNAIGSVNSFDVAVVQALPSENISTHTIYLVSKTGETNDVYDEYIYINNAWEMVGNTQIDLSGYALKSEIPDVPVEDVQINGTSIVNNGIAEIPVRSNIVSDSNELVTSNAIYNTLMGFTSTSLSQIKDGSTTVRLISPSNQHQAVFYGLAKAAGSDEKDSSLPVGQYTDAAKAAIQNMLNVPDKADILEKFSNLQDDVDSKATAIYKTAGPGSTISFSDGADGAIKSLTADLIQQNLHGYDHPRAAGHGINMLPPVCNNSDFTIDENGAYSQNNPSSAGWPWSYSRNVVNVTVQPGTYTVSFHAVTITDGNTAELRVFTSTGSQLKAISGSNKQSGSATFTVDAETTIGICIKCYTGVWKLQLEEGSTASDWAPYKNICPMTGNTSIDIYVSGADTTTPTVTHIAFVDPETEDPITVYGGILAIDSDGTQHIDICQYYESYNGETLAGPWRSSIDTYDPEAAPTVGAQVVDYGSVIKSFSLAGNPIYTQYGENTIWSSTGGNVIVKYLADSELYIEEAMKVKDVQIDGTSIVQDGVASVPVANQGKLGVLAVNANWSYGISIGAQNDIRIRSASIQALKADSGSLYLPVTAGIIKEASFYGLAKAAGYNENNSTLPAGQYTENAKSAIHEMLNGPVTVTGTTPVITALPGISYKCGEVATLTVTLPASGCIDVVFESGSTPTVLTVTPPTGVTLRWANGFDPTNIAQNTTYEINILDGLGVACTWM